MSSSRFSRRESVRLFAKAGAVVTLSSQLGSKAEAAGRHSDPFFCDTPVCYAKGTQIELQRGRAPIERVLIGDKVRTHRGDWAEVKWVGRMVIERAPGSDWKHVQKPVLFERGSISDNVPDRDLYVSQQHAMLIDDVLIPAKYLVNGDSVRIVSPAGETIEYLQIECENHEVIYAHGAGSETLFATELRTRFSNHREYAALYGAGPERRLHAYRPILRHSTIWSKIRALGVAALAALGVDVADPVQRARDSLRRRARNLSKAPVTRVARAQSVPT